ncbi:polysaccharide pyruvyl transferase family protein [Paenarthrobacter nitroguajacolicus]
MAARVLVLWADAESSNLGVRVLGDGAAALARRAWGNDTTVDFQSFEFGALGTQLSGKIVARGLLTGNRALFRRISSYDAVIDTGAGDSFTDIYGLKRLAIMVYTRYVARSAGVPIVLAPQTIGPFKSVLGRLAAKKTLRDARTVMARDSTSAQFAADLGRDVDCLATDVVFSLPKPLAPGRQASDVVLNVSGLLWRTDGHGSSADYRRLMREIICECLATGRHVTLMAHVIDNPSDDNDLHAILPLKEEFGDRVSVFIPSGLDDAREFISESNVVIGSRMHACLNALSIGIPAIPLAYSRKFAPLLSDIGWPYTIELKSDTAIVAKVAALLSNKVLADEALQVREHAQRRLDGAAVRLAQQIEVP